MPVTSGQQFQASQVPFPPSLKRQKQCRSLKMHGKLLRPELFLLPMHRQLYWHVDYFQHQRPTISLWLDKLSAYGIIFQLGSDDVCAYSVNQVCWQAMLQMHQGSQSQFSTCFLVLHDGMAWFHLLVNISWPDVLTTTFSGGNSVVATVAGKEHEQLLLFRWEFSGCNRCWKGTWTAPAFQVGIQ